MKFGQHHVNAYTNLNMELFGVNDTQPYIKLSEVEANYITLGREQKNGSKNSITICFHGIGKPLDVGDKDPITKKASDLSWESFGQGTFPNKNEKLRFARWNTKQDKVDDKTIPSLGYYALHSEDVKDVARNAIINAYNEYVKNGRVDKINILCHSLGSVIMYEVLTEAETTGLWIDKPKGIKLKLGQGTDTATDKYFTIDKFIVMGAVIRFFHPLDSTTQFDEDKIKRFINIYSPKDVVGTLYDCSYLSVSSLATILTLIPKTKVIGSAMAIGLTNLNNKPTGEIFNDKVTNVELDVDHATMWFNPQTIRKIGEYY